MQIGTLQDEEDEGSAPTCQEESSEPFLQPVLGVFFDVNKGNSGFFCHGTNTLQSNFIFLCAALSKPHLFENRGHNRQGSDSSMDRFVPKEEPAEPEPDNKVKRRHDHETRGQLNVSCIYTWLYCPVSQPSRIKGAIGHYTDQGAEPLVHCVRLLAASFLLTGKKNGEC